MTFSSRLVHAVKYTPLWCCCNKMLLGLTSCLLSAPPMDQPAPVELYRPLVFTHLYSHTWCRKRATSSHCYAQYPNTNILLPHFFLSCSMSIYTAAEVVREKAAVFHTPGLLFVLLPNRSRDIFWIIGGSRFFPDVSETFYPSLVCVTPIQTISFSLWICTGNKSTWFTELLSSVWTWALVLRGLGTLFQICTCNEFVSF